MIVDVCTQRYQWADQWIIKTHPDLAAFAIASNSIQPAYPDTSAAPIASAKSTKQLENLKRLMHQNLEQKHGIDNMETLVETIIPAPQVPQQDEHQKAKDYTKPTSPVMPSPKDQTAKNHWHDRARFCIFHTGKSWHHRICRSDWNLSHRNRCLP